MPPSVKRLEKGINVVVGKPLAWAIYGLWLAGIHLVIAIAWTTENLREWWIERKRRQTLIKMTPPKKRMTTAA